MPDRKSQGSAAVRGGPMPDRKSQGSAAVRGGPMLPAAALAISAALVLSLLIYFGSRRFKDFDSALIGYAIGTVFATAAIVYRYTVWITRPPTWRYFMGGWRNFLSWRNFRRYTVLVPVALWRDIFAQTFILRRGFSRWLMHICIFWGVVLSLLVTLPLTFGWIRFTLVPPDLYQLWFAGIPMSRFPVHAGIGFALFHALDFTAALLLIGLGIALWRRFTDMGLTTGQRFGFDLMPLILLFAIAVTGIALTASSLWWEGRFYWFISLTHQVAVVGWLLWIPYGKFFHIVQRPASVGVTLYQTVNQNIEGTSPGSAPAACRNCGMPLPSEQFVRDIKATLADLGQEYTLGGELGSLHDYCPTCKRRLRGEAYYELMGKGFM